MMDENRRSFLKKAGYTALGLGCGFPLLGSGCGPLPEGRAEQASSSSQLAMVIDIQKCLNKEVRQACIEACNREHNLPHADPRKPERDVKWIWNEKYQIAFPDQSRAHTEEALKEKYGCQAEWQQEPLPVLVLCNHCTHPACVKVCPTVATWKRESDGVVMMDMHRCIGCRYCVVACPYGARSFNWGYPRQHIDKTRPEYPTRSKGVVEKCTFCVERIGEGRQPACVEAASQVPGGEGALTFGDLSDPDSEVSRLLRQQRTISRRNALGTGPNVYYIV